MSPVTVRTRVFQSYDKWVEAGRPSGGVMPVEAYALQAQHGHRWSPHYLGPALRGELQTYYVALPTGHLWCPWQLPYSTDKGYHGDGWIISGPPERLTVTPSISVMGWHGYLTDGELRPV